MRLCIHCNISPWIDFDDRTLQTILPVQVIQCLKLRMAACINSCSMCGKLNLAITLTDHQVIT
jgi:hypothetical protein